MDFIANNIAGLGIKKSGEESFIITALSDQSTKAFICFKDIIDVGEISMEKHDYVFDKYLLLSTPNVINSVNTSEQDTIILPIPMHLKKNLDPIGDENSSLKVSGILRCTCKCESFRIKTLREGNQQNSIVDGSYVKIVCTNCQQEHLVFDSHSHGWNGYICSYMPERNLEMELFNIDCESCDSTTFKVSVTISSQGQEDFVRELQQEIQDGKFTKEEWVNAFDWITISLTCSECGKTFSRFVDYETM